ncbi:hypothetical protein VP01_715g3 [Puccinia sorghi]|uniref:Uncharacterized protein n=1 Tax=Puccinia sorghi TaxID=27349 RepID=A0A0L6UE80_9BASI|nr:hypothetical protein VP01_715g3 [Puccinia sorghi]
MESHLGNGGDTPPPPAPSPSPSPSPSPTPIPPPPDNPGITSPVSSVPLPYKSSHTSACSPSFEPPPIVRRSFHHFWPPLLVPGNLPIGFPSHVYTRLMRPLCDHPRPCHPTYGFLHAVMPSSSCHSSGLFDLFFFRTSFFFISSIVLEPLASDSIHDRLSAPLKKDCDVINDEKERNTRARFSEHNGVGVARQRREYESSSPTPKKKKRGGSPTTNHDAILLDGWLPSSSCLRSHASLFEDRHCLLFFSFYEIQLLITLETCSEKESNHATYHWRIELGGAWQEETESRWGMLVVAPACSRAQCYSVFTYLPSAQSTHPRPQEYPDRPNRAKAVFMTKKSPSKGVIFSVWRSGGDYYYGGNCKEGEPDEKSDLAAEEGNGESNNIKKNIVANVRLTWRVAFSFIFGECYFLGGWGKCRRGNRVHCVIVRGSKGGGSERRLRCGCERAKCFSC